MRNSGRQAGAMVMRLAWAAIAVLLTQWPAVAQEVPAFDTARIYATADEFARAIRPYQEAIAADARNARAQYWLGFAYLHAYRHSRLGTAPYASDYLPRAVPPLLEAIKLDPEFLAAYVALQDAYWLLGESERAQTVLQELLRRVRPGGLPVIIGR